MFVILGLAMDANGGSFYLHYISVKILQGGYSFSIVASFQGATLRAFQLTMSLAETKFD